MTTGAEPEWGRGIGKAGDYALTEARALRLVLATIRADKNTDAMFAAWLLFDEIDCIEGFEHLAGALAAFLAEELIIAHGSEKAARDLEKRIAGLLDFAASRHEPPT